ncbi:glycoside hydrolase family 28 protein [Ramaria rubella]|nr:glycoside hydrolase family 28 protein [Ramaria rubella]
MIMRPITSTSCAQPTSTNGLLTAASCVTIVKEDKYRLTSRSMVAASAFTTCIVPHQDGTDDVPALQATIADCSSNAKILFKQGTTYNISTPVKFGTLNNVEIAFEGNLQLPKGIPYVQSIVNASGGSVHWFTISGTNVTISGSQDPDWGWIDTYGEPWWVAAQLTDPGGLPTMHSDSVIRWLKLRKPIAWNFSVAGNNIHVYNITIDASYDLSVRFDVSGTNVIIENSKIFNGDDCVAVNNGAHNVTVRGLTCEGGHGVSLSGTDNISNITFDDIFSRNSLYATRFKSSLDSVGNVSDVTWSNIHVLNATFPIFATGVYFDQNTNRGRTPGNYPPNSTATSIKNFTWENVTGTINSEFPGDGSCTTVPCWYAVEGVTNTEGIVLQLLNNTATNIVTKNINLMPIDGVGTTDVFCSKSGFTDAGSTLGFVCRNGPYKVAK